MFVCCLILCGYKWYRISYGLRTQSSHISILLDFSRAVNTKRKFIQCVNQPSISVSILPLNAINEVEHTHKRARVKNITQSKRIPHYSYTHTHSHWYWSSWRADCVTVCTFRYCERLAFPATSIFEAWPKSRPKSLLLYCGVQHTKNGIACCKFNIERKNVTDYIS